MRQVTLPISRMAALSMAAAAIIVVSIFACGGSDGTPAIGDPEGGTSSGDGGPRVEGCAASTDPDNDKVFTAHPDAGCELKSAGPRSGTVATSVPRSGAAGVAWTSPQNARGIDCESAKATIGDDESTELLRITNYGFNLPNTATIKGVVVQFKRQAPETGVADGNIALWLDGTPSDRPKFVGSGWPSVIVGTHHYGQEVDTWGNDLTPELVAKPGFGVEMFAKRRQDDAGTGPKPANVESMRITIWYCE